jgi:hypothetical protein
MVSHPSTVGAFSTISITSSAISVFSIPASRKQKRSPPPISAPGGLANRLRFLQNGQKVNAPLLCHCLCNSRECLASLFCPVDVYKCFPCLRMTIRIESVCGIIRSFCVACRIQFRQSLQPKTRQVLESCHASPPEEHNLRPDTAHDDKHETLIRS